MSMGTVFAFIAAIMVVVGAIVSATDRPSAFIDVPSMIIVAGGTFVALFISYEIKTAIAALRLMGKTFSRHADSEASLKDEIGRIVRWAYIIQKNGLQGLENEITPELRDKNPFLAYGSDLVVTGYTGAEINQILDQMLEAESDRNKTALDALKKMGGDAPAFGMLGTLIGLIIMLGKMGGDPSAIGPSMAVALVTTFYGIILARIIFIPLATKMSARYDVSLFKNNMLKEGMVLLAERKSPRYIQDKINSFVDVRDQFLIDRDLNNTAAQSEN